jgi:hypothetical protein
VAVFANQLVEPESLPAPRTGPFTIGWAGSPGHFADWWAIAPVLQQWLAAHPEVHMAVMCNGLARGFLTLPADRYHFKEFASLPEYMAFLRQVDVGIAPLLPTDYNRCRSDVKFLEYASAGAVGVYSDLDPYRDSVVDGQTGMIYRTGDDLASALDQLYADSDVRLRIRSRAHEWVTSQRLLVDHISTRIAWYQELIDAAQTRRRNGTAKTQGAPPTSSATDGWQEADSGYSQLRLSASEDRLRSLVDGSSLSGELAETPSADAKSQPSAVIEALTSLVESDPDYVAARQRLGFLLNSHTRPQEALDILKVARELAPESARTRMEMGRSHLLLSHGHDAKVELIKLIGDVPGFVPGWEYLVRLLRVIRDPESEVWAERALHTFPTCYPLGLAAIESFSVNDAATHLAGLIDSVAPGLMPLERPTAVAAFRTTIGTVLGAHPDAAPALALLSSAARGFPESAMIAGWHGDVLRQVGQLSLATAELARAGALRRAAEAVTAEFPVGTQMPWPWALAEVAHTSVEGEGSGLAVNAPPK